MKPDNDPLSCHSTLVCKHDSKPFEYNNSAFDTAELEGVMKGNQNGALRDLNNYENDAARLAPDISMKDGYFNTPEPECTMVVKDSTNGSENVINDSVAPCTISSSKRELFERERGLFSDKNGSENEVRNENDFRDSVALCTIPSSKMELFEKETDLYTDKNVMECELPELMVCYKDNAYHVVKDICIDEGVPSKDKVLVECGNDKDICTFLPSDGDKNGGMTGGGEEIEVLSFNGSKSSPENHPHEVDTCERGTKEKVCGELHIVDALRPSAETGFDNGIGNGGESLVPVQMGEANYNATDEIDDDASTEEFVTDCMHSSQKFRSQRSLKSLLDSDDNEVELQSAQIQCSKETPESPAVIAAPEESNESNPVNDMSYNSKVESGTITFDFNSSKPAASGRDETTGDVDHEQPFKTGSEPTNEDGVSDSLAAASEVQHGQGESSFSIPGPVSGLITYSGPIAFSGSVSFRSDSSTTSTRSFAFPVLQSEWNSSPVRMSKADRRHYRRQKGWRQGLLCCRF